LPQHFDLVLDGIAPVAGRNGEPTIRSALLLNRFEDGKSRFITGKMPVRGQP